MDELYRVGERVAQDHAGLAEDPAAFMQALGGDPALAELLAGGGDIEQYLQSYEQMLAQGVTTGPQLNEVDAEGGVTVRPDPGFVIKTRDIKSGMKVFINVVSNEHVEKPHMKSFAELEGEEGCRVPLSVGTPVEDFDKKNEPCVTYDLVANPEVVKECIDSAAFRDQLTQLCMAAVSQKYKIELDARYKLPKIKYKGTTVQLQRIRKAKQSQIQELSSAQRAISSDAPVPGEGAARKAKAAMLQNRADGEEGQARPEFCVYYARPGAQVVNGFEASWPAPPETVAEAAERELLLGWDLPCYRVNAFQEKIRGTMKSKVEREQESDAPEAEPGEQETRDMLAGRICIVQVRMPQLDPQIPSLKQFGVEVSDECLRVTFPLLPRSGRTAYAPLTIWWPHTFHADLASAEWSTQADVLTVSLPTTPPERGAQTAEDESLDSIS